ncbi:MAG: hypothetical protein P1P90_02155 [Patescibacteria group bacterium]|nr:hypothetical protein [Patescibacteria group bacterium]
MTKQEVAFQAFKAYLFKARISHVIGIMRLQDAIRTKYQKDVFLRDPWSIKKINDEEAEMVIAVVDSLDVSSITKKVQDQLGLS